MKRLLLGAAASAGLLLTGSPAALAQAPNLDRLEYFYDTDPGLGLATAIPVTPNPALTVSHTAPVNGLANGFHLMGLRAKDASDQWSLTTFYPFLKENVRAAGLANITQGEYFFDTDPGYGQGTAISVTPAPALDFTVTAGVAGLSKGFHILYARFLDQDGNWSLVQGKPFLKEEVTPGTPVNLSRIEYFLDTDPGYGLGTSVPFAAGSSADVPFAVSLSGVADGPHALYMRAKDQQGNWSILSNRYFLKTSFSPGNNAQVTALEYFFDTDPGYGQGLPVSITPTTSANVSFTADLSAVPDGFHLMYVRAKDQYGNWSLVNHRAFFKENITIGTPATVTAAEYFVDTDPGYGQGTAIPLTANANQNLTPVVDLNGVSNGFHVLYVRARNQFGRWSLSAYRPFMKEENVAAGALPTISGFRYYLTQTGNPAAQAARIYSGFVPSTALTLGFDPLLCAAAAGNYFLRLQPVDSRGVPGLDYVHPFALSTPNTAPQRTAITPDQTYFPSEPSQLLIDADGLFQDGNLSAGDSISYQVQTLHGFTTATLNTAHEVWVSTGAVDGTDTLLIRAFDRCGNVATDTVQLKVSNTPLPVTLVGFTATLLPNGREALLQWRTAQELNNNRFEVEESSDGRTFRLLGTVSGQGTTVRPHNYEWIDRKLETGLNYYRLKQVDEDGAVTFSQVVALRTQTTAQAVFSSVSPNPFHHQLSIAFALPAPETVQLSLYSLNGEHLRTVNYSAQAGLNVQELTGLEGLASGIYLLRLQTGTQVLHQRVMKK